MTVSSTTVLKQKFLMSTFTCYEHILWSFSFKQVTFMRNTNPVKTVVINLQFKANHKGNLHLQEPTK
jgi:hypothetical protein